MASFHLKDRETGRIYPTDEPRWRGDSGGFVELDGRPLLEPFRLSDRPPALWRYRDVLPLSGEAFVSLGETLTPLLPIEMAGRRVWVKQDQLLPTGSFKDRGAAVMVSKMKELGVRRAVQDSSGNAGAAVAAYCARAGIGCDIYVPQSTSAEKLRQICSYGANLILVPGDREETARVAFAAAQTGYYASHCWNPFFHHGIKTFSYEVCEQLGWHAPDCVVLPAGNGSLLIGVAIGFAELSSMNLIKKLPRLVAVQTQAYAPLFRAFERVAGEAIGSQPTIAEGIAITAPIRLQDMLAAIEKTRGKVLTVTDGEIVHARDEMGRMGFFIEPTAAVAIAGVKKYLQAGKHDERETVVTLFTGHGLKSSK